MEAIRQPSIPVGSTQVFDPTALVAGSYDRRSHQRCDVMRMARRQCRRAIQ